MTQSKTVRVPDADALRRVRTALQDLLHTDVSESLTIDAGLAALAEKLSGRLLPVDRVKPVILKCQVEAMSRLVQDLITLGYPVEGVQISLTGTGIHVTHDNETLSDYGVSDPAAAMNLIN